MTALRDRAHIIGRRGARLPLAIGVIAILGLSAGMVYAAIPNSDTGVINGCYEKRTGLLRVIDVQAGRSCTRWETPISWNEEGSQGEQGLPGLQGLPGRDGADGVDGLDGQAGADGVNGADGADGRDGNTILNGTSTPSADAGLVGDFYLDTTTSMLYGPKSDLGWGEGVSLVGPQGPQGEPGPAGPGGPGGGTGDPGGGAECTGTAPTYPNANAVCASGTWTYACFGTWADVNRVASDGCEIDTSTDAEHCGPSLTDLTTLPHVQSAMCVGTLPQLVCDAGWEDVLVDGKPSDSFGTQRFDGCESATRPDGLTLHDAGTGLTYAFGAPRGSPRNETTYTAAMAQAAATATMNAAIASNPGLGWSFTSLAECAGGAVWLEAHFAPVPTWVMWVYSGPSAGELYTSEFGYQVLDGGGCGSGSSYVGEWN